MHSMTTLSAKDYGTDFGLRVDHAARMPDPPYFDEAAVGRTGTTLPNSLEQLEALVQRDMNMTRYSSKRWVLPRTGPDGKPALNVLVVGAGQAGLAAAFGLMQHRIDNFLVIDENPEGHEGPWGTYARMATLRTHKDNGGIELGIPNLSVRAWYEAQHGHGAWDAMYKVGTLDWHNYLAWYRRVLNLPVRNGARLTNFGPGPDGLLRAEIATQTGTEVLYARTIILATGIEGNGQRYIPPFIAEVVAPKQRSHTHDEIDFAALGGKRVAVLGGGGSAYDNAIRAAEHGAEVDIFHRLSPVNSINPGTWTEFNGYLAHYPDLSPLEKWRFSRAVAQLKGGPPKSTVARAQQLKNLTIHGGQSWNGVQQDGDDVIVEATNGRFVADHLILGTGYYVDLNVCEELVPHLPHIALWGDVFSPPAGEASPTLSKASWLGSHFELLEKTPGCAPWFKSVFNFSRGAQLSMGVGSIGLSGIKFGVPRLVEGVGKRLFKDDTEAYMEGLRQWQCSDLDYLDT
jgi:cation diffusion facilitator CzcD-associated flavoprotein CzcO